MKKLYFYSFILFLFSAFLFSCEVSQNAEKNQENTAEVENLEEKIKDKQENKQDEKKQRKTVVKIMTWNLYNFGKSKTAEDIAYMASKMKAYDIVAVQEVSTTPPGAQAVAKLADELNRTGSQWDYVLSDPTTGEGKERYAYLWKTSKAELKGKAWLEKSLEDEIDREPYMARFTIKKTQEILLLGSLHAIPSAKNPETEVVLLGAIPKKYPKDKVLIMGDFNLSEKHEAFDKLKNRGLVPCITNQKTSLRQKLKKGESLAQEYDNIFYDKNLKMADSGVIEFYADFKNLDKAHDISDHIPVWLQLEF